MSWDKTKDELREQTVRQTNRRKKTAKWCRGKVGVPHVTEVVVNHNIVSLTCGWRQLYRFRDGERQVWRWHYSCKHAIKCVNCGKYIETFLKPEQCPDASPRPE